MMGGCGNVEAHGRATKEVPHYNRKEFLGRDGVMWGTLA